MKYILSMASLYFKRLDKLLISLCFIAGAYGVVLLYSLYLSEISPYILKQHYITQAALTIMGVLFALIINALNYRFFVKLWFIYAPAALILVLLLFTPLGIIADGTDNLGWLNLGIATIQPSEFLKVAFIMTFALHLSKLGARLNKFPHIILVALHGLAPIGLILITGDTGSALVFIFIFLFMLFIAGLWWRYIFVMLAAIPVGVYVVWNYFLQSYQKMRILVIIDKEIQAEQALNLFDQQRRSLLAIGSGQLTGNGLIGGDYIYIPVIQSDFIFSYIGMALGFIGCVATVALLLFICGKILHVLLVARDMLGKLICIGVFTIILCHSTINIGMTLAVVPVIGIPLPFISAGGSNLLALFISIGLVLSVYSHKDKQYHMFYTEKD